MPRSINLDAAAAVRRESIGENIEVVFLGDTYLLPVELPLSVMEPLAGLVEAAGSDLGEGQDDVALLALLGRGKEAIYASLAELFGAEQWAKFRAGRPEHPGRPTLTDMWELLSQLMAAYGVTLGEALGPIASALSGGPSSAPTSNGGTGLTPAASGAAPG